MTFRRTLTGINQTLDLKDQKGMFEKVTRLFENAKSQVLVFTNSTTFILTTYNDRLKALKVDARKRGIKLRYITEITKENLPYCKRQMSMVDELRHLDGTKGNFILSDKEFIVSPEISARYPMNNGVYGNYDKILEQYWHLFETLWSHAILANDRIRSLEEVPKAQKPAIKQRVIDRLYICKECNDIFVYAEDAQEHSMSKGHKNIKEVPL